MYLPKKDVTRKLNSLDDQLFDLYWVKGKISLSARNQLRELLKELRENFDRLFMVARSVFHRPPKRVLEKEFAQLNNIVQCMEYNLGQLAA